MTFDWDDHYRAGGKSGASSDYAKANRWKRNIIQTHCDTEHDTFLDVGCGDLQLWDGVLPSHYTGIDISQVIVQQNREAYPIAQFFRGDATFLAGFSADIVLCFDMLWHIVDYDAYIQILENLKRSARKKIFIFTWCTDPSKENVQTWVRYTLCNLQHGGYQKYYPFAQIGIPVFAPEFRLERIDIYPENRYGAMYVFQKATWVTDV